MVDLLLNDDGSFAVTSGGALLLVTDGVGCEQCEPIACVECPNCEPCNKATESPCCPPDCCTPRTLRVVLSGFDSSVCLNCYNCNGTVGPGGSSAKYLALNFDGTFCIPQSGGDPCNYFKKLNTQNVDVECLEASALGFCDDPGSICVLDLEINIDRLASSIWRVRMNIGISFSCAGAPCDDLIGLWFEKTVTVSKCDKPFVMTNTTSCVCLSSPLADIGNPASGGTVTVTPCFGPGLC